MRYYQIYSQQSGMTLWAGAHESVEEAFAALDAEVGGTPTAQNDPDIRCEEYETQGELRAALAEDKDPSAQGALAALPEA